MSNKLIKTLLEEKENILTKLSLIDNVLNYYQDDFIPEGNRQKYCSEACGMKKKKKEVKENMIFNNLKLIPQPSDNPYTIIEQINNKR